MSFTCKLIIWWVLGLAVSEGFAPCDIPLCPPCGVAECVLDSSYPPLPLHTPPLHLFSCSERNLSRPGFHCLQKASLCQAPRTPFVLAQLTGAGSRRSVGPAPARRKLQEGQAGSILEGSLEEVALELGFEDVCGNEASGGKQVDILRWGG